jgi:hypothetical protein
MVPQLWAPNYAAAVTRDHLDYLPFITSPEGKLMADSLMASSSSSSPLSSPSGASPVVCVARSFARSLVPLANPARRIPKPISIARIRPSKVGAFRRPLGSMFSATVSIPQAPKVQPKHTPESDAINLAPAWLTQGLTWNDNVSSVAFELPSLATPKKTKKEPANKKHVKQSKRKPLHTRAEKKRSATSRAPVEPAKTKSSGANKHRLQPKALIFRPTIPLPLALSVRTCLAQTC